MKLKISLNCRCDKYTHGAFVIKMNYIWAQYREGRILREPRWGITQTAISGKSRRKSGDKREKLGYASKLVKRRRF